MSMKACAGVLGIIPSSDLDLALWQHIATDDEDLVRDHPRRPEAMF